MPPAERTTTGAVTESPPLPPAVSTPSAKSQSPEPTTETLANVSERKRLLTALLCLLFGIFGAHRFYAGRPLSGFFQLITLGGFVIWFVVDLFIVVFGEFRDGDGKKIVEWT